MPIFNPMKELEANILDLDDVNRPIYRIFSRERFLELIQTHKNTLVRPRLWDDPFENFFFKCTAQTDKGEDVSMERIREKWYGQCWTTEKDTDSMWRIYSHNKDGVRVRSTPRKLLSSLLNKFSAGEISHRGFIGKVAYKSRDEIDEFLDGRTVNFVLLNPKTTARTMLVKRNEFKHENEVRILYQDILTENHEAIFKYDFDVIGVIEEVATDPRSDPEEQKMLEWYLKSLSIDIPVVRSSLYDGFAPRKIRFSGA